ncbi:MAG: Holliday junction resolvase RuvX [Clostridiaceae bacterium]|nr:Holliday junction resolvase RuvX [Clostridiaceae bacterium]
MRIMGIDFGEARIGIAVSDPLGITAQAVETICWNKEWKKPIERIEALMKDYNCDKIVVGLPVNMNGTIGERGERTRQFINRLKQAFPGTAVIEWDERLSTAQSKQILAEMGISSRKHKGKIDQMAAALILQSYIDANRT